MPFALFGLQSLGIVVRVVDERYHRFVVGILASLIMILPPVLLFALKK